jgi:hypothetical protein
MHFAGRMVDFLSNIKYMIIFVAKGMISNFYSYDFDVVIHFLDFVSFVVRPGQNFGVDFTLYRDSPSLCHSELCVLVVEDGASLPTWRQIMTLTRIVPDVMKLLVLCYVMRCSSVESSSNDLVVDGSMSSPWAHALAQYSVRPVTTIIRRPGARSEPVSASARDIQLKFRSKSRLSAPRKTRPGMKKRLSLFRIAELINGVFSNLWCVCVCAGLFVVMMTSLSDTRRSSARTSSPPSKTA